MEYSEDFYRLALIRQEGFGPATLKKILQLAGSATLAFTNPTSWMSHIRKRKRAVSALHINDTIRREVDQELRLMATRDIHLCFFQDKEYPYRLKSCPDSPLAFYYKGDGDFNKPRTIALVGTRDATEYGRRCVNKILLELRNADVVTVSGLAYGIDTEVHAQSINNGLRTIAVLGSGLGNVYPKQNEKLAHDIVSHGGSLISEFRYDAQPDRLNFPKRNRIIAGLADATIVVESGEKGGSIITAHIAQSYNRDVFAVPGRITDQSHDGCHNLIRQNIAAIVTSGNDILDLMNWNKTQTAIQTQLFVDLSDEETLLVETIRNAGAVSLDKISEQFPNYTPSKLAGLLLGLELKSVITCKPGKYYSIRI